MRPGLLAFIAVAALARPAVAQDAAARIGEYLDARCAARQLHGVALVARGGEPIATRACGVANAEWNVPNGPDTRFRIGSITKSFTAVALLRLEAAGKLTLGDPVCTWIDECPSAWKQVTVHHLLAHASGIPDFVPRLSTVKVAAADPPLVGTMKLFRELPLRFTPGSDYEYSNSNYTLAAMVVEKASGQPLAAFLKQEVFDPLGMADTGRDDEVTLVPRRAAGYELGKDGLKNAHHSDMSRAIGAGDLYSTVLDLLKFDQALSGDRLLPAAARQKLFTPVRDYYACGFFVRQKLGRPAAYHPGAGVGSSSALVRFPDDALTVIVLSNLGNAQAPKLAFDLAALALGRKVPGPEDRQPAAAVAPATLEGYVGEYKLDDGPAFTVLHEGGHLLLQPKGAPVKLPLVAQSERVFYLKQADAEITFGSSVDGKATHFYVEQNGLDVKARRVTAPAP